MRLQYVILTLAVAACTRTYPEATIDNPQPVAVVTTAVSVPTELVTVRPGYITAWTGKDPAAFEVFFAPTATVTTPTGTFTGWTDISGKWIGAMLPNLSNYAVTPVTFTREGNVIIESGNLSYHLMNGANMQNVSGAYTYRWAQQADGTWKLVSVTIK
jgi:ketosteroid isomerase-like protein